MFLYIYKCLGHFAVQQKLPHYKSTIILLKNLKKKENVCQVVL